LQRVRLGTFARRQETGVIAERGKARSLSSSDIAGGAAYEIKKKTRCRRRWDVGSRHRNDRRRGQLLFHRDRGQDATGKWRHCPLCGGHCKKVGMGKTRQ
jgi:hypothetical protein